MSRRKVKHEIVNGVEMKRCRVCGKLLPLSEFYKDRHHSDGLQHICKACALKESKEYYRKYSDDIIKKQKQRNLKRRKEKEKMLLMEQENEKLKKLIEKLNEEIEERRNKGAKGAGRGTASFIRKNQLKANTELFFEEQRRMARKLHRYEEIDLIDKVEMRFEQMLKSFIKKDE